jgi:hypothetical protein
LINEIIGPFSNKLLVVEIVVGAELPRVIEPSESKEILPPLLAATFPPEVREPEKSMPPPP